MTIEQKSKRERRTNEQLEQDILNAIESLVCKKGFTEIPLMEFINEAHIDPNVFYRRYKTVSDVYSTLAKRNDFWINDSIEMSELPKLGDKAFFASGLKKLCNTLRDNLIMQKLLIWELSEVNETTKHSAQFRDTMNSNLVLYYKRIFDEVGIDIAPIIALMISGIYYLTLHRGIATFCLIDFSTEEGQKKLSSTIDTITEMLFRHIEHQKKQVFMAKEMAQDGITHQNICKYMGITPKELKGLLK